MKILFVMTSNSGTAYWRMFNFWESAYRTGKCEAHVLGWEKDCNTAAPWQFQIGDANHAPRLFGLLYSAGLQADVIVFQRVQSDWALTTFYAMRDQFPNKPILSEIDDDITDIAYYNQAHDQFKPGSDLMRLGLAQFQNSDGLIVSTPYLKEVYSEFNEHIYVVPNSIDVEKWNRLKHRARPGLRIGWAGSTSHVEDLALLQEPIKRILAKNPRVKFSFMSASIPEFLKIKGVEAVEKWTPILKYPQALASQDYDIFLAPLVDNKFNRAKSNLRWLEASALGIPTVASKVGHFKETIHHRRNGLLVETADEWVSAIQELIDNREFRIQVGMCAKDRIFQNFNADKNLDIYIDACKDVLTRPVKQPPSTVIGVDEMQGEYELSPLTREAA